MIKRLTDMLLSLVGLILALPLILPALLLVWLQDGHSPLYMADRAGRGGRPFRMIKIRSMVVAADRSGVSSTAATDARITRVGRFVRRWKLDELTQLWNVLVGDMSLVGPRPNTLREVADYTPDQRQLLSVRPGITDLSSIVFSDEGEILRGADDPDRLYFQIIWPWKSALGLLYVRNSGAWLDLQLIGITVIAVFDRARALDMLQLLLVRLGAPPDVIEAAARKTDLRTLVGAS